MYDPPSLCVCSLGCGKEARAPGGNAPSAMAVSAWGACVLRAWGQPSRSLRCSVKSRYASSRLTGRKCGSYSEKISRTCRGRRRGEEGVELVVYPHTRPKVATKSFSSRRERAAGLSVCCGGPACLLFKGSMLLPVSF